MDSSVSCSISASKAYIFQTNLIYNSPNNCTDSLYVHQSCLKGTRWYILQYNRYTFLATILTDQKSLKGYFCKQRRPIWNAAYGGFLIRIFTFCKQQRQSLVKEIQCFVVVVVVVVVVFRVFFLGGGGGDEDGIIIYDPSIYTMDHLDPTVTNSMENSIGLKGLNVNGSSQPDSS